MTGFGYLGLALELGGGARTGPPPSILPFSPNSTWACPCPHVKDRWPKTSREASVIAPHCLANSLPPHCWPQNPKLTLSPICGLYPPPHLTHL